MRVEYPAETWFHPALAAHPSAIHGTGLFTTAPIAAGEVVLVWGGTTWTRAQLEAGEVPPCSFSFVDEDVLLAGPADGLDYFVNHSCDPSVWMADEVTVVARRALSPGDELTGDYVFWEGDEGELIASCSCGSAPCRGTVRGADRDLPELRERYAGHFLPYLERRFR